MTFLYIDPGSGSLLLQFLIAIVVGIGVFFKNIRLYFLSFFGGRKRRNAEEESQQPEEKNTA